MKLIILDEMGRTFCCVRNCGAHVREGKVFSFPQTLERAEKWKQACANPLLDDLPIDKLCRRVVVCKKHFSLDQFVHPLVEKLNRGAVPTLFLPLETNQNAMQDSKITTPIDPVLLQHVIVPPIDMAGDLAVADDPETCSNDSRDTDIGLSEAMPSLASSVLPSVQGLLDNEEGETSVLQSTAAEMTKPGSFITPINNYDRHIEDSEASMLESSAAEMTKPESSIAPIKNYDRHTEDSETSVLESTAIEMMKSESYIAPIKNYDRHTEDRETSVLGSTATEMTKPESPIGPINSYYRYTLCRLCFSISDFMVNIFEDGHRCGFVISDAIEDLLQFKVSKADDYPKFVCSSCLTKLGELKKYKEQFIKKKEVFDEELNKHKQSGCEDNGDIITVRGVDYPLRDEDLESSQDVGSMKHLDDIEEIPEVCESEEELDHKDSTYEENENISFGDYSEEMDCPDESSSEAEEAITDLEDTAEKYLAEPETTKEKNLYLKELSFQEEYKCQECGEVFKYLNLFKKHTKEHQKSRPIPCQYCGKRFRSLLELNHHIIKHSDYKPFECEHCGLRCRLKVTLAKHKLTHSDERPFLCSTCGISFRSWFLLKNHLRKHAGIKCYKCEECDKEFITWRSMNNHKRSHTNERPYICGECGKSFRKRCRLNWHLICIHTDKKLFQCKLCEKSFSLRIYLNNHMKIHLKRAL